MTYPGALSNPILARIGVSLIGQAPPPITRTFITLDSAQQGHYLIQNPVVETGDFNWTFEISSNVTTLDMAMIDLDLVTAAAGDVLFYIDNPDGVQLVISDGVGGLSRKIFGGQLDVLNGDLNTLTLRRLSGVITYLLNDTPVGTTLLNSDTLRVAGLLGGGALRLVDGIIANPDLGNGNAWKLDRATGNTEQAAGGNNLLTYVNIPEGAPDRELFTLNTSTDPDQWENADKSRIIQVA